MNIEDYKYIIIGGGICGLITSIELAKKDPGEVLLIEKERNLGGHLRTIGRNGYKYDLGSHIIHYEVEQNVLNYINDVSGDILVKNERTGKLILRKSFIDYPLKSIKFMAGLGFKESVLCSLSLIKGKILKIIQSQYRFESNYEDDLKRNVGVRAYNIFYKPYALKVWNCDPKKISSTAIKRQMAMVGPMMLLNEFINYTFKKQHKKYYYYLKGGIGKFPEGLEKQAVKNKVKILKNVTDFSLKRDQVIITRNKVNSTYKFKKLISTIPIEAMLQKLKFKTSQIEILRKLHYRGLKLVFIHINEDVLIEGESFYLPETKYKIGRVSIPGRFSKEMQPSNAPTSIICEIPCSENDYYWNMGIHEASMLSFNNLKEAGLIKGKVFESSSYDFYINLPYVYPMYYNNWKVYLKSVLEFIAIRYPNIYISGKAGFFMQSNLDRSIEMGKTLPKFIHDGRSPKDWYEKFEYYNNLLLRD